MLGDRDCLVGWVRGNSLASWKSYQVLGTHVSLAPGCRYMLSMSQSLFDLGGSGDTVCGGLAAWFPTLDSSDMHLDRCGRPTAGRARLADSPTCHRHLDGRLHKLHLTPRGRRHITITGCRNGKSTDRVRIIIEMEDGMKRCLDGQLSLRDFHRVALQMFNPMLLRR